MLSKILNVIKTEPEMISAVVQTVLGVIVSLGFSLTADETGAKLTVSPGLTRVDGSRRIPGLPGVSLVRVEPPIGIEPMTYALRGCSRALPAGSESVLAPCWQVAAGGDRWLLMAVRGHLRGHTRGA